MPRKKPKPQRKYRQVIRAVHETPWAIREEKLQQIRAFLLRRSAGDVLSREEIAAALSGRPQPVAAESKKVALINVMGTICQRMSLMEEISGGCSTEAIGRAIDQAAADDNVSTIVLNVDSPGGSVFGVPELAAKIFAARQKKRIIAVANSEAASAAYWIATAASELAVTPSGWVGSIGVLMIHYSTAGWEAKEGYETTITRQPEGKAQGAAGEALTDDAKAYRQKLVDQTYEQFVADVAKHRGKTAAQVASDFGRGRMVMAEEAKAAGMVDRIATLQDVLSELGVSAAPTGSPSEPAFPLESFEMNKKIFGALVRIGMVPITATIAEATEALDRFFAAKGCDAPKSDDEQLAALEAHIKTLGAGGSGGQPPPPPTGASRPATSTLAADERAADITAAVRLCTSIPAARQIEMVSQLISERDSAGQPITVQAAIKKIQTIAAEIAAGQAPGATVIRPGAAEQDKFRVAARDALLVRTMGGDLPQQIYDRRTQEHVDWRPARGHRQVSSLLGVAEQCLIQAGYDSQQVRDLPRATLARIAVGGRPSDHGLHGSSDGAAYNVSGMFSNILLDASHVTLRRGYDDSRTTYQAWMKRNPSIEDFKINNSAVAGELGDPRAVPEDGSFEETTFSDAKERYQLTVWGELFSLSWQAVVNDALGAFMAVPTKMGSAMRRKENRLAYQVLKDNAALADTGLLFNATAQTTAGGHNNLSTGAGTPTVANLNTLTKRMMEMRGLNTTEGGALNLMPRFIVSCPALRGTILELLGSFANPAAGGSAAGSSGVKNIWENALEPVIEGELGAAATGGSDTAWYLATDSNDCETIGYAYLQGLESPVIETEQAFNQLALRWRIYLAFATWAMDFRGLQKHAGA